MTDLRGRRILVVEDAYYLAMDVKTALEDAGAEVVGPFPDAASATEAFGPAALTGALLDVNLGGGASFEVARALRDRGVPFVFFTGYDRSVIPAEFSDAPRLEKPVTNARLLKTIQDHCQPSTLI